MSEITAKGQTVEEAVQAALRQMQVSREQVEIQVITEGKKGFLGLFGAKPAIVTVSLKQVAEKMAAVEAAVPEAEPVPEPKPKVEVDPVAESKRYLEAIIREMEIDAEVTAAVKGRDVTFTLSGTQVAILIGKRGNTLNSLQYLTQLVANHHTRNYINIIVDAENYREKRKGTLEALAKRLAKQAATTRKKVVLEPMPSFERKVIHQALTNHPYVNTASEGAEPGRHVVIIPK